MIILMVLMTMLMPYGFWMAKPFSYTHINIYKITDMTDNAFDYTPLSAYKIYPVWSAVSPLPCALYTALHTLLILLKELFIPVYLHVNTEKKIIPTAKLGPHHQPSFSFQNLQRQDREIRSYFIDCSILSHICFRNLWVTLIISSLTRNT